MSVQMIDCDKFGLPLRRLSDKEIHCLLTKAVEMLPAAKLQRLVKGHFNMGIGSRLTWEFERINLVA